MSVALTALPMAAAGSDRMVAGDFDGNGRLDLAVDFGSADGVWIWLNNAEWVQLQLDDVTPETMVAADIDGGGQADLIVDFGPGAGIWVWENNSRWLQLHEHSPETLFAADLDRDGRSDLFVDFGPPSGTWVRFNNHEWTQLDELAPRDVVSGDFDASGQDDLVADLGPGNGTWVSLDGADWYQIHPRSPQAMATGAFRSPGQDELVVDFGVGEGVWLWRHDSDWTQLHESSPEAIAVGDLDANTRDDVVIDLGPGEGVWVWRHDATWQQLHRLSPETMVVADLDANARDDVALDFRSALGLVVWQNDSAWASARPNSSIARANEDSDAGRPAAFRAATSGVFSEEIATDGRSVPNESLSVEAASAIPALNELVSETDIAFDAVGLPVRFIRTYLLDSTFRGPLGYGWTHSYRMRVVIPPYDTTENASPPTVQLFNADGTGSDFRSNGDGSYRSTKGDFRTLTRLENGAHELRSKTGLRHYFSPNGKLFMVVDPSGNRLRLFYDKRDRLTRIKDGSGQVTSLRYGRHDRIRRVTDPAGRFVRYAYDARGNLVSSRDITGRITRYQYDSQHNLTGITDPVGNRLFFAIDARGRLVGVEGEEGVNRTAFQYDEPSRGDLSITDALGKTTVTTFNKRGLVTRTVDPSGNVTQFSYGPNLSLTGVTDALGRQSSFRYDNRGNPLTTTDAEGGVLALSYDRAWNRVSSLTDDHGNRTEFSFDGAGRLVATTFPDASAETLSYDAFGNVKSRTDRNGQTIEYSYDKAGRLVRKSFPDRTADTFVYDRRGRLTTASDENGAIRFAYDRRDQLSRVRYPSGETVKYAYDMAGNRSRVVYPDGRTLKYHYDTLNRLARISDAGSMVVEYAYDERGRIIRRDVGNGTHTTYEYDESGRLLDLFNRRSAGGVFSFFSYTYDRVGHRLSTTTKEGTTKYTYDRIGQLTDVRYPGASKTRYVLDSRGNRTTAVHDGVSTDYVTNAMNQYSVVGGDTYDYDQNGNTISKTSGATVTTYTYDFENRLVQVVTSTETVAYSYDPFGRRILKTSPAGTTRYFHDGLRVIMEKDDAGTVRASYVHSQRLDEIVQMNRNNVDYYYSQDGLGSVTEVTDSSGRVLETYSYDAYGIPSATSSLGNPYLFTGQEFDDETGLYFLRARYYDPRLGRFLTSDPLGVLFETNLYSYVSNNPISNVDPLGFASTFTGLAPPTDGRWVLRGVLYPDLLSIDQEKRRLLGEFVDDVFWGDFIDLYQPGVDIWDYVKFVLTLDNKSQNLLDTLRYFDELKEAGPLGIWEEVDPSVAVPCAGVGCPNTAGVGGEDPAVPDCTIPGACTCDELDPMLCAADPTFIQMPVSELAGFSISTKSVGGADPAPPLIARIDVPIEGALVRADVPVFGVAYGEQFEEYRVQIGQGSNPTNWTEIASANSPQETSVEAGDLDDSFNTSIQGNLATWDTGLTNYVYLPSHPAGHPIDLRGTYTIRLVATGRDGTEAEDRATLTVANVIPNAWGGVATSPDERLRLVVPEQALRDVFRLVSFETVDDVPVGPPVGANLVGPVYRAREVGEQFTKPVTLEVSPPKAQLGSVAPHRLGLYGYDEEADVWVYLPSTRSEKPDVTLKASVTTLHAFYTVMASDAPDEGSRLAPARPPGAPVTSGESFGHFLIQDTFEETTGAWSSRDGDAGASVSLDRTASFDDTGALKIVNVNAGGTQAVTVIDAPFDARRHPIVQFDYRIPSDVRTNLFAKVAGRWYEVAFTDGEKHLVNQRVNIASIGRIDGVIADDGWHTAQFNLYEMLRTKTGNVVVEEMVMADWNVLGYMKLAFGSNEKDATYYIDNFSIARDVNAGLPIGDEILLVDDFNKKKDANLLRGPVTTFTDGSLETIRVSFAADVTGVVGNTLSLVADFRDQGTFGGYISSLTDLDLRGFQALTFRMQGTGTEGMLVGLKDDDDYESKLPVDDFAGSADADGWRQVEVPLVAFGSELRLSRMDNLSLSFEAVEHDSLTVQVDDLAFGRTLEAALVDDFEHDSATNRLSGGRGTRTDGPGAVGTGYVSDESGRALRVSYGGSIGEALDGVAGLGYATWYTSLGGIDCTACAVLSFRIRGEAGGETPNVYLADGNFRWGVNVEDYAPVTTSWQSVSIPIADVAGYGVDLTHLAEVEFAFEWEEMSGTVYLDDIRLGPAVPTPIAGADSPDPVP